MIVSVERYQRSARNWYYSQRHIGTGQNVIMVTLHRYRHHTNVGYDYSKSSIDMHEVKDERNMDGWKFQANVSVFPLKTLEFYASGVETLTEQISGGHKRNSYLNAGVRWIKPSYEIELALNNLTNEDTYSVAKTIMSDTFYYQYTLRTFEGVLTFRYNF